MTHTDVLWRSDEFASLEHATLSASEDGQRLSGVTVLPIGGTPGHMVHVVELDEAWAFRSLYVHVVVGGEGRDLTIARNGDWVVDGEPRPDLAACTDVDLGWSPGTNTIPIRRAGLGDVDSIDVTAAWLRFPSFEVVPSTQRYTRLGAHLWRYESSSVGCEIAVDDAGLVTRYGDDVWVAA